MNEFIFATIGLIVGGTIGTLVMSMCTVSKKADEDMRKESRDAVWSRVYGAAIHNSERSLFDSDIHSAEREGEWYCREHRCEYCDKAEETKS